MTFLHILVPSSRIGQSQQDVDADMLMAELNRSIVAIQSASNIDEFCFFVKNSLKIAIFLFLYGCYSNQRDSDSSRIVNSPPVVTDAMCVYLMYDSCDSGFAFSVEDSDHEAILSG